MEGSYIKAEKSKAKPATLATEDKANWIDDEGNGKWTLHCAMPYNPSPGRRPVCLNETRIELQDNGSQYW